MTSTPTPMTGESGFCTECGRTYATQDLVRIGNSLVCANCKGLYAQKMREGAMVTGAVVYGGFWRRAAALVLDGLILSVVNFAINAVLGTAMGPRLTATPGGNPFTPQFGALMGTSFVVNLAIGMAYQVFFLTRTGATPGKMVLGLKVIRADGGPITPGLAIGRYFSYILDSLILGIGYIMVAFDKEKRALHDHICGTRVIRTS